MGFGSTAEIRVNVQSYSGAGLTVMTRLMRNLRFMVETYELMFDFLWCVMVCNYGWKISSR